MDTNELTRFLLGDISEPDRIRIEQSFFSDDERFEQLRALEDELMYDYLRGELSVRDRTRFEQRFLASAPQREQVEFARALLARTLRVRESKWWRPVIRFAIAAAAMTLLILPTWVVFWRPAVAPAPPPTIVSFALSPGRTRSETEPRRLLISQGTDLVEFQLERRRRADFPTYRAAIRTAEGLEVWSADNLPIPIVRISSRLLAPNDYELTLQGRSASAFEDLGDYYFTVVR